MRYVVNYWIGRAVARNSMWRHYQVGPFASRNVAELTIANLAINPDFRGGEIIALEGAPCEPTLSSA